MTRIKTKRNPNGLKKGDIIRPIKGRFRSNIAGIKHLKKAKIIETKEYNWNNSMLIVCIILEGSITYGYTIYKLPCQQYIELNANAFELCNTTDEYEIF
jgi:hypothetical protein